MNTPEWLKPGIYGALIGAVFVGVVGFTWGGWVTGGTANDRAMAMSRDDVVASMVPVCLDMARSDPARAATLATIRAASTYQRRDALMTAGWATMPGTDAPTETSRKPAWQPSMSMDHRSARKTRSMKDEPCHANSVAPSNARARHSPKCQNRDRSLRCLLMRMDRKIADLGKQADPRSP
jgi:hypothetical protein